MRKLFCLVLPWCAFSLSCREFIEPSLNGRSIVAIAPAANLETSNYQLTFWWQTEEDALQYRLQVVSPSFDKAEKLILDTLLRSARFTYTLDPGKYQWRVRAENGSSQTPYTTQGFTVYPSSLTGQSIQLINPVNNLFTAAPDLQLEWLGLFGATQYRLQIDNRNFADENNLVMNTTTGNLSFLKALTLEGNYQFRVRAENASELSKWSVVRNFIYDISPPVMVSLTSPGNGQTVSKPVKLVWDALADADKYELLVYRSDLISLYNNSFPILLTTNSYTINVGDVGETIGWKVRAIDKAGNKGAFSSMATLILQ